MHCKDCGFANGEDDHRCLRCGRRLSGVVIAAPAGYSGANALAMAPIFNETQELQPAQSPLFSTSLTAPSDTNVIPFDQIRQRATGRLTPAPAATIDKPAAPAAQPRPQAKKTAAPPAEQGSLDFVRAAPQPRTLTNRVPAQIFCEQAVATPQHRLVASAIDAALILMAFGVDRKSVV